MGDITNKGLDEVYKDLLHTNNSNSGISTSIKQVACGDGDLTSLYLSTQNAKIQPATDSTANTVIYDANGNALLTVDSTNDLVKLGIGQHTANTQYAYFGVDRTLSSSFVANTHHAIPFVTNATTSNTYQDEVDFGTGTDPATTFTTASSTGSHAGELVPFLWFLPDNITIDSITSFEGGDSATGDTNRMHCFSYTFTSGSTSALTAGTLLAHNSDVANDGSEQAYKSTWTVDSANVDANKVILAFFEGDSVNADYSVNIIVKYHLR